MPGVKDTEEGRDSTRKWQCLKGTAVAASVVVDREASASDCSASPFGPLSPAGASQGQRGTGSH